MHVVKLCSPLRLFTCVGVKIVPTCLSSTKPDFRPNISADLHENIRILDDLIDQDKPIIASLFVRKLIKDPKLVSNVILGRYFRYINVKVLNSKIDNIIIQCYKALKEKYSVIDPITADSCAIALSRTSEWRTALELISSIKLVNNPSKKCLVYAAAAAFRHFEYQLGYDLIGDDKVEILKSQDNEQPFLTLIKSIHLQQNYAELEKFLRYAQKSCITFHVKVAEQIEQLIKTRSENECFVSSIDSADRTCNRCGNQFEKCIISEDEFFVLKEDFYRQVVLGKNIYSKTTPEEIKSFLDLLKSEGPWHMVIDGLNIGYLKGRNISTNKRRELIERMINYFHKNQKKVLLLGRNHMYRWFKDATPRIRKKATIFFVNNLSQDDPFFLYAALSSGLGTEYLSRDLMRSHSSLLSTHSLKLTFQKWRLLHQYSIDDKTNEIIKPKQYLVTTQKVGDYWHLPFLDPDVKWLCFKF